MLMGHVQFLKSVVKTLTLQLVLFLLWDKNDSVGYIFFLRSEFGHIWALLWNPQQSKNAKWIYRIAKTSLS